MSEPALQVSSVWAAYGAAVALQDASLDAALGRITGVGGPNGAGKSTLLKAISGAVRVSRGQITFLDESLANKASHRIVRAGVVHVPEGRRMLRGLTVNENLRVGGLAHRRHVSQRLEAVVALFPELGRLMDQEASRLSGGEQQMVAIGRGLMASPKLIMVDELSLGLAPQVVKRIAEGLKRLSSQEGIGVIVVDQSLEVLRKVVDSLAVLVNGRVVFSTHDPRADFDDARAAYLGGGREAHEPAPAERRP